MRTRQRTMTGAMTLAEFLRAYPLRYVDEVFIQWRGKAGWAENDFHVPNTDDELEALLDELGAIADKKISDVKPDDRDLILELE